MGVALAGGVWPRDQDAALKPRPCPWPGPAAGTAVIPTSSGFSLALARVLWDLRP